eukprot:GFUD01005355.1.p1 GENE.GFUD01005355.1~~GFUD01005355.1.p1  ORF type:complete len:419 (+),score=103.30 GFUD01005355.1:64-1320(+)
MSLKRSVDVMERNIKEDELKNKKNCTDLHIDDNENKIENKASDLEIKSKEASKTYEEEIRCLKLEIETGNKNFKEVEDANKKALTELNNVIEENKKQHEAQIEVLKAQHAEEMIKVNWKWKWKMIATKISVQEKNEKKHAIEIEEVRTKMEEVEDEYEYLLCQMKEKIECPVCMEIPRSGPVYVCPNGHFVCKKCKTGSCPTCRVAMGDGKSLLAVLVIENIDHECKYDYCEEVLGFDKLEDHEKQCKHRIVSCPHAVCREEISLSKLLDHLGKKTCAYDAVPQVIDNTSKSGQVRFSIKSELAVKDMTWKMSTFSYQDKSFAIFPTKSDDLYFFTMVMFDSDEVCSKYNIEMEVHEWQPTSKDSEISFKFCGSPCSIDEDKKELKYLGLTLNNRSMEKILKKSKDNSFSVSFSFFQK